MTADQEHEDSEYRVSHYRRRNLKYKHGLTVEDYDKLLKAQNSVCKICHEVNIGKLPKSYRGLAVDHNHKTGKIRGLLCHKCNTLIGLADENPTILLRAIQYIKGNL